MRKRILFQKQSDTSGTVRSCDEWNIMPSGIDKILMPEMKELASNDWLDEDGDDEYIPDTPKFKGFELTVTFIYKGDDPKTDITGFFQYLTQGGAFSIYDEHSGYGRTNVRYMKYNPTAYHVNDNGQDGVVFEITFKVNDPITTITLSKNV